MDYYMDSMDRKMTPQMSVSPDKQLVTNQKSITNKSKSTANQVNDVPNNIHSTDDLKTFMSFLCDGHTIEMGTAVKSSIEIFRYCIPSRGAVLAFYRELFDEYSTYFWTLQKRSIGINDGSNKGRIEYVGDLTRRFYEMAQLKLSDAREDQQSEFGGSIQPPIVTRTSPSKSVSSIAGPASPTCSQSCSSPTPGPKVIPTTPRIIPVSRRTSSCNSNNIEQTPMSPSAQDTDDNLDSGAHYDSDAFDIFHELEELISLIRSTLEDMICQYGLHDREDISATSLVINKRGRFRETLIDWASELLINLDVKHHKVAFFVASDLSKTNTSNLLSKEIEIRLKNPVNKLLVDVLLESHNDIQSLFRKLIDSTQNWDWLLAHILAELSKRIKRDRDFSSCMEFIIDCQSAAKSVTHILAYLSDTNPKAMANFPKSNIPFLISLCQTSTSLLNVLAQEIPETVNPEFLNKLAEEVYDRSGNHLPCIASLAHCIISAPNSYKLFILALEVKLDDRVNSNVKSAAQCIIDSIISKVQERAMTQIPPQHLLLRNQQVLHIDNLLDQIKSDPNKLIEKCFGSKFIEKKAQEIFYRMSLIYGIYFASEIVGQYLNLPEQTFWSILRPLLNKFMEQFGDDGSTLVSQTLSLDSRLKTPTYWRNINSLIIAMPKLKLNLDLISQLLVDKLSAANFDIASVAQLIKLCVNSLEQVDHNRICISTKHRLCQSLATCFFLLLENDTDNFPETLSYIRISLTCMSLLKQSSVASHILCRALLERSIVYKYLFNEPDTIGAEIDSHDWTQDESIKLSRENLKISLGHRFRRLPNHIPERSNTKNRQHLSDIKTNDRNSTEPGKQSINCYLLIEAFKSSINDIEAFATLFVEFHCPVMFDKHSWPSDDALRAINERNLSILRKFEQIPPLWDLYELIGQAGCLKSCLVLVKALFAAHLALWASATTNLSQDKMVSTSRLIPPLAQSNLVPEAFGLTVEVFPQLASNEVFSVLSDIWQYLKDTNSNGYSDIEMSEAEKRLKDKAYLNRLRLFMCQHIPGPLYVKIFKNFHKPIVSK